MIASGYELVGDASSSPSWIGSSPVREPKTPVSARFHLVQHTRGLKMWWEMLAIRLQSDENYGELQPACADSRRELEHGTHIAELPVR